MDGNRVFGRVARLPPMDVRREIGEYITCVLPSHVLYLSISLKKGSPLLEYGCDVCLFDIIRICCSNQ